MSDGSDSGITWLGSATFWIALSTVVAAIFVALQTWYARVAIVEAAETELLQSKIDACFETVDAATRLDQALRSLARAGDTADVWPPMVAADTGAELRAIQTRVPPLLAQLESSLMKGSIFGDLDSPRAYLVQQISGLGERLVALNPAQMTEMAGSEEVTSLFATLSDFIGAQYLVFEGCKTVAQRTN